MTGPRDDRGIAKASTINRYDRRRVQAPERLTLWLHAVSRDLSLERLHQPADVQLHLDPVPNRFDHFVRNGARRLPRSKNCRTCWPIPRKSMLVHPRPAGIKRDHGKHNPCAGRRPVRERRRDRVVQSPVHPACTTHQAPASPMADTTRNKAIFIASAPATLNAARSKADMQVGQPACSHGVLRSNRALVSRPELRLRRCLERNGLSASRCDLQPEWCNEIASRVALAELASRRQFSGSTESLQHLRWRRDKPVGRRQTVVLSSQGIKGVYAALRCHCRPVESGRVWRMWTQSQAQEASPTEAGPPGDWRMPVPPWQCRQARRKRH
jgi:hypothetical protein